MSKETIERFKVHHIVHPIICNQICQFELSKRFPQSRKFTKCCILWAAQQFFCVVAVQIDSCQDLTTPVNGGNRMNFATTLIESLKSLGQLPNNRFYPIWFALCLALILGIITAL